MIILHSNQLLEHLTELEEKIQLIENLVERLELDCDQEKLLKSILAKKFSGPSGQNS